VGTVGATHLRARRHGRQSQQCGHRRHTNNPHGVLPHSRTGRGSPHRRSDLHTFAGPIQSSQNGPHLLQPPSARPTAIKPMTTTTRRNMAVPLYRYHTASHRGISSRREPGFLLEKPPPTLHQH
jgi:hypothetical protein